MSPSSSYRWRRSAGLVADAFRAASLLCIGLAVLTWGVDKAAMFALVFGLLLIPRAAGMPQPYDVLLAAALFAATLTGSVGWYESISWWDKAAHIFTNGLGAAMAHLLLLRFGIIQVPSRPRWGHRRLPLLVSVTAFGLSLAVGWELSEWIVNLIEDDAAGVGYADTMGDLAAGAAGSVAAGILLPIEAGSTGLNRGAKAAGTVQ